MDEIKMSRRTRLRVQALQVAREAPEVFVGDGLAAVLRQLIREVVREELKLQRSAESQKKKKKKNAAGLVAVPDPKSE